MERLAPEHAQGGARTITAAIAGSVAVATAKLVAAALIGSSAILSEAIHSVDGILLVIGRRRSTRPPARAQFRPDLRAGEVAEAVARIERRLKERHPELKYLFLDGTCLTASG